MDRQSLSGSPTLLAVTLAVAAAAPLPVRAEQTLREVVVVADRIAPVSPRAAPLAAFTLAGEPLATAVATTPDTAALIAAEPGVATAAGGGVSSLPVIHGFADDQINVLTAGMVITSACGNHMNPPLSYIDPANVGSVEVLTSLVPVSKGGDSLGGTIIVEPRAPRFATGPGLAIHGGFGLAYRSNGNGISGWVDASVADADWSLEYTGAYTRAGNYEAGGGRVVRSTDYEAKNHAATLARRLDNGLITLSAGLQDIPYQGFPNVRMDMLSNRVGFVNARYQGAFDWGRLDARAYYQRTEHYMNFLPDKYSGRVVTATTGMPMYTKGEDMGWAVKGEIELGDRGLLHVGNEFNHTTLDDWWPPVAGMTTTMCCNTFWNIAGGRRDRLSTYAEWEKTWSKEWSTLIGIRNDDVFMDTGNVQGYSNVNTGPSMMGMPVTVYYLRDSAAFNARSHSKTDINFDLTALARWKPIDTVDTEFGYTRKTRSPNLYERYAWSTGTMASRMISWAGDANGYVGDIDLKPEVAHTVSGTLALHDPARERWEAKVTPWYAYVENFIDADRHTQQLGTGAFPLLKFANHDASLWGIDVSGRTTLGSIGDFGQLSLSAAASYTHGENLDTHDGLYRIMPLNGRIALEHKLGAWGNSIELVAVSSKTDVSATRNEIKTPGYALLNWATHYQWGDVRFDLGIENIFDHKYFLPLGGVDFGDYKAGGSVGAIGALPGRGRTVYAGVAMRF